MVVNSNNVEATEILPGVFRKILSYNENIMTCEFSFNQGAIVAEHSHLHTQTSYVLEGTIEFFVEDESYILTAGGNILIPSNKKHHVKILKAAKIIDIFTPCRKDFLK